MTHASAEPRRSRVWVVLGWVWRIVCKTLYVIVMAYYYVVAALFACMAVGIVVVYVPKIAVFGLDAAAYVGPVILSYTRSVVQHVDARHEDGMRIIERIEMERDKP